MIVLRGTPAQARILRMSQFINTFRNSGANLGPLARTLPACNREPDRCFRRWILATGGYWSTPNPTSVASDSEARAAVRRLQADIGVTVDGTWWGDTQRGLERALGMSVPEAVPDDGFPPTPRHGETPTPPNGGGGELDLPVSAVKKAGIVMASLGILAVVGAAITAWVMRKRKRA